MGRLFGTDGIRGEAGIVLTPQLAFKLGQAAGHVLLMDAPAGQSNTVVIGRDGRLSGQMLEAALTAGLTSVGMHVISVGVLPTPAVAWLVRDNRAMAGVVISASHNPYWDNGIKFFDHAGKKLSDAKEDEIQKYVEAPEQIVTADRHSIGQVMVDGSAIERYALFLNDLAVTDRFDYRIVVDCANGAASAVAETLLKGLGARCKIINGSPNGVNINDRCGSTDMNHLQEEVRLWKADLGIAFDGDADRFLAVDEAGKIIDGDHLLAIYGRHFKEQNALKNNKLVLTVMSNLGLKLALSKLDIQVIETKVGDRYVNEGMQAHQAILGGEQSGHIIFSEYNTTGDGLLSAIMLLNIMHQSKESLSALAQVMTSLPQVLINVPVSEKEGWETVEAIQKAIQKGNESLGEEGRILVRASGTEQLLRVMVEGPDEGITQRIAEDIAAVIRQVRGV